MSVGSVLQNAFHFIELHIRTAAPSGYAVSTYEILDCAWVSEMLCRAVENECGPVHKLKTSVVFWKQSRKPLNGYRMRRCRALRETVWCRRAT